MKTDYYSFQSDEKALLFEFDSISNKRVIRKVVAYTLLSSNPQIFNLALGDLLENGEISDLTISNNSDMPKVIATVVQTMLLFF